MKSAIKYFLSQIRGDHRDSLRSLRLCGTILFLINSASLHSQSSPDIFIRTFATHDSIMLRWVPANTETWKLGNKYGYEIERFTADEYLDLKGQDPTGKGTILNSNPILPLAKNDSTWNKLIREDKINAFVYQSIYENTNSTSSDPAKRKLEEQTKFGLILKACDVSLNTAKAHGLFFVDKNIVRGQIYFYRIRIANLPAEIKCNPGIATADEKISVLKSPNKLCGDFRNRKVALTFDVATTREEFAGYIIERSEDSIHFERINSTLLTFTHSQYEQNKTEVVFQDTFPLNHKTYWYRVRGYSYFGFAGPPSSTVKGKGRDEWNYYPEIDTLFSIDNKQVKLKWHIPPMKDSSYLKGFVVLCATKSDGHYENKNSLGKNIFEFNDDKPLFVNYYIICALSTEGDSAFSFPYLFQLKDNEPPPIPENLAGTVDTNGIVRLSWNRVSAVDLKGYRVFRSNSLKEEFYEVSDSILPENIFIDTIAIKTLTRDVFYCVRSVDKMYNNSKNAPPCKLKRPDKIPPVPIVVKTIFHSDTTIDFSWINSSSDDIRCMELIRKSSLGETQKLGNWNGKDTVQHFTDFSATIGLDYSYFIILTDSSENSSTTNFPTIHFQPRINPALKNLSAVPDFEKRIITLSWDAPQQKVDRYIIYKSKVEEPLREWKTIDGNKVSIIDKELYPGNTYVYKVKAIMKSGAETKLVMVQLVF